jgi:hypothetical protein
MKIVWSEKMTTISQLENGCNDFLALYEDIRDKKDTSEDTKKLLEDYYKESYENIKEMMEG